MIGIKKCQKSVFVQNSLSYTDAILLLVAYSTNLKKYMYGLKKKLLEEKFPRNLIHFVAWVSLRPQK